MARDTFYEENYICSNKNCEISAKHYVWASKVDTFTPKCSTCGSDMVLNDNIQQTVFPAIIGLRKEQNLAQRRQRNHKHFKKEVLPDITDSDAKRHHFKKLGIKN